MHFNKSPLPAPWAMHIHIDRRCGTDPVPKGHSISSRDTPVKSDRKAQPSPCRLQRSRQEQAYMYL